ncbi:RNA polymerase sigma-70 factor (ECF subfamily) [Chitinivorax tropicus]|uniref:RNA polymerase sigma-70 factor (ECF subfamily) n=1 Tax=Chitinivorax tropicus TaxID=714531 RepID=A0A840MJH2_9PROT|nr:RNA polymerase sigma factor SigJ [Chitinivorax tropicus]MBB5017329.1 RNA polymerase sigma-70 factor (ECF subfamily) [Chitinivorax tropicus]
MDFMLEQTTHLQTFLAEQSRLRRLAYRMLGDITSADDAVQDAYLRWHGMALSEIVNPQAWLVTTVSRLCLDHLRARQPDRLDYYGEWLPTPVDGDVALGADPAYGLERASDISLALLVLLEQLSAEERVAFIMQEVFDHDYRMIAQVMDRSEAACRQLVRRARQRLVARQQRFQADPGQRRAVLAGFVAALAQGDLKALLATLSPEVELRSDGGGVVKAASKPVFGSRAVSRLLLGIRRVIPPTIRFSPAWINEEPALVGRCADHVSHVLSFAIDERGIGGIYLINNPAKLVGVR